MSPHCRNCGAHVSERYVRVFSRRGVDHVECCPDCEDCVRQGGIVREAKVPADETPYDGGGVA